MFDITNIPQKRTRTREVKDASGKRVRTKEDYWGVRPVNVIMGFERFSHYFVDAIIIMAVDFLIAILMNVLASSPLGFSISLFFGFAFAPTGWLVVFAYYSLFEWKFASTPGKMIFGRVVMMKKGTPPDTQAALTRSLVRFIPFEAFSCFSDRGWHDRFTDTYVVSKEERDAILVALNDANQKASEQVQQKTQS
jgi:uncharacterized RDD family membrane protein YckC